MIFKSHQLNIQSGQTDIAYTTIQSLVPEKSMKWLDNRLKIITRDGKTYGFVLNERDRWLEVLRERLPAKS
jgi:hypothetical protein